jgi:NAD dependent epimerase/dehydratase family enzyme
MNYNEIDVDKIVNEVSVAVAHRNYRKATKKEAMEVRLAALAMLVKNMQSEMHDIVQDEKELSHAHGV